MDLHHHDRLIIVGPHALLVLLERVGDVLHSKADIGLGGELIGYLSVIDFETGLEDVLAYYKSVFAQIIS